VAFTFFLRDRQTLDVIAHMVLPALRGYRYVHVWDAGCAHGPEVYSLAMLLRENMTHFGFRNIRILATDIDDRFGRIVTEGVYPERELRRIPPALMEKYFQPAGTPGHFRICDEIRQSVSFVQHDLLTLRPPRSGFHLIVCKNVLLHFPPMRRVDVVRMFHDSLAEGGFFATEHTQPLPDTGGLAFERITSNAQVFRKLTAPNNSYSAAGAPKNRSHQANTRRFSYDDNGGKEQTEAIAIE